MTIISNMNFYVTCKKDLRRIFSVLFYNPSVERSIIFLFVPSKNIRKISSLQVYFHLVNVMGEMGCLCCHSKSLGILDNSSLKGKMTSTSKGYKPK